MSYKKITYSSDLFMKTAILLSVAVLLFGTVYADIQKQKTFPTPEDAVNSMVKAIGDNDDKELLLIFGKGSEKLVTSGDSVEDKRDREEFLKLYNEKNHLQTVGKTKAVLYIGMKDWPFPVPILKDGAVWRFDAKQGMLEIISRRIGKNELDAIQTCLAIVDAEREYSTVDYNGNGWLEYAPKLFSDPGKKNGLYWEVNQGEKPSPLGPLAAKAQSEGYVKGAKPVPYNGYFYKILTRQGKLAQGGAHSYIVKGRMIGGFAVLAYPAAYGDSGVMTFMVSYKGVVFQKNLGSKTSDIANAIKAFNPDKTWSQVK